MRKSARPLASGSKVAPKNYPGRGIKSESRGRPRSEESEAAILEATIKLLFKKPLRDISMEEIARNAGVGKATIYKWWSCKTYVALDAFASKLNQVVPVPDTGSFRRDILEQLRAWIDFNTSPAGHIASQFVAESQINKEFASFFRKRFLKPRREAIRIMFERGVQRGEIDVNVDKDLALDMIYGPVIYRVMVGHAPVDYKTAEEITSILLCGLEKRSSEKAVIAGKATRNAISLM
jgi:AcrR family transcriptional regulator